MRLRKTDFELHGYYKCICQSMTSNFQSAYVKYWTTTMIHMMQAMQFLWFNNLNVRSTSWICHLNFSGWSSIIDNKKRFLSTASVYRNNDQIDEEQKQIMKCKRPKIYKPNWYHERCKIVKKERVMWLIPNWGADKFNYYYYYSDSNITKFIFRIQHLCIKLVLLFNILWILDQLPYTIAEFYYHH